MRLTNTAIGHPVHELGRRIYLPGGSQAVLMLHGWTGWPGRLAYLADRAHDAGFTVSVPRLPGHGTSISDMRHTGARDWLRRSVDEFMDLQAEHERVHIVGTSMGAILATIIAVTQDTGRLALLAPAFTNRNRLIRLSPWVKWLVRRVPGSWREENEADPKARELGREYGTHNYVSLAAELLRVQRMGRRMLPRLVAPTLVVVSEADRTVAPTVADYVERRSKAAEFRKVIVHRSNHQIAEHLDREYVADEVVRWLSVG